MNKMSIAFARKRCIHSLFEEQVERRPDAVALIHDNEQLSYRELNIRANQLAHYLMLQGAGPESLIGICVERSIEMVVGLLGILKAGAAYVPLDPAHPKERLQFMLEDSGAELLLTRQNIGKLLIDNGARQICLDSDWHSICAQSDQNPVNSITGENAAYVIYTSGSTGKPKGVMGLHRATINRLQWMWDRFPFSPSDLCCQKTNLSFVDSVWEIFGPLLAGVASVIIADEEAKDPERLAEALARHKVSRVVLVPSLLRAMLSTVDEIGESLECLKVWVSSGEALTVDLSRSFKQEMKQARLLNLYGSSEVAGDASFYEVRGDEEGSIVGIGEAIANTRMYVVDEEWRLVGEGVAGELMIGGEGLARGYHKRADLTGERFVPDPYSGEEGARMYASGDVVRRRAGGGIEYIGRRDNQVKVRGHRIEMGEIESEMRGHESVEESVVVAREGEGGEVRLEGYVVKKRGKEVSGRELRKYLKERMPEQMVPGVIVVMEEMPRTASGKVDRRRLPKGEVRDEEMEREYEGPRN